jgi:hypothetical protein
MGLTAKVMGKVLKSIGTKAKSILPSTIEITSFD